jgi:hypothetical protein
MSTNRRPPRATDACGRDRIIWLTHPVTLPGTTIPILGYDAAATQLERWLLDMLEDS